MVRAMQVVCAAVIVVVALAACGGEASERAAPPPEPPVPAEPAPSPQPPAGTSQEPSEPAASPRLPAAHAKDPSEWNEADLEDLKAFYTDEEVDGFEQAGGYLGWRAGIREDGTWLFFVSGD